MSKYVGFKIDKLHESHVISEYYCGGCGYPLTDHDSFCPECGGALRECDADTLEAENAKLREVIDDITEVVEFSDPALVEFIAKRMERIRTEVGE